MLLRQPMNGHQSNKKGNKMNTKEKLSLLGIIESMAWEKLKIAISNNCRHKKFLDTIIKVQTIRKGLDK